MKNNNSFFTWGFLLAIVFLSFSCEDKNKKESQNAVAPASVVSCSPEMIQQTQSAFQPNPSFKVELSQLQQGVYLYMHSETLVSFNAQSAMIAEEKNNSKSNGSFDISTNIKCKSSTFHVESAKEIKITGLQSFQLYPNNVQYIDRNFLFKSEKIDVGFWFTLTSQGQYTSIQQLHDFLKTNSFSDEYAFYKLNATDVVLVLKKRISAHEFLFVKTLYKLQ